MLSVPGNVLSNIIYDRIKDRGCSDHVFASWHNIEQCEEWQKSIVLNFIEFKKAFDRVLLGSMWKIV